MVDTPSKDILFDKLDVKKSSSPSAIESLYKRYESLPLPQQIALAVAPGTGEAISAYETPMFAGKAKEAFDKGEYLEAAGKGGLATLSALGAIPGLGLGIRAIKGGAKAATKIDEIGEGLSSILKSEKKLQDYGDAWKANPKNKVSQRQKQHPTVKQAAEDLDSGKIKGKQFRDIVKEKLPIKPIKEMVDVPTFKEMVGALHKNKAKIGIVGRGGKEIAEGTRLSTRLDIPAYDDYNKWIVSIHEAGTKGKSIGYGKTARLKNVVFGTPSTDTSKKALKIAKGKNKNPFARMEGDWTNTPDEDTASFAERLLKNKKDGKYIDDAKEEWIQVGMNPYRGSYFYDKATGQALQAADELIQVGPLVFAKNKLGMESSRVKSAIKSFEKKQGRKLDPNKKEDIKIINQIRIDAKKPTLSEYKKGFTTTTEAGNKVAFKQGGQIMPMQYGGGLDDAYMNRRRSSAFAAPNATSAFASPMSQGGLPTVYRFYGGATGDASASDVEDGEGFENVDFGGGETFEEPVTNQGGLWEPKPAEEINRELMQKEREEKANKAAINQLYHMQLYGRVGQKQDDRGLRTGPTAPINNRSYNFDFTPSLPAASNPPSTPIKDSSPKIDEKLLDVKLRDLSRPDFNRLWKSLSGRMTGVQSNKFDRHGPNLDNTAREAIAAAKEILDGPTSTRKTGGGLPTIYRSTGSGISDEDMAAMAAELDQEDYDAGAAPRGVDTNRGDVGEYYATLDKTGIPSQAASIAADKINAQVFANYNRGNLDLLSQGAYNALIGTGLNDGQIANLTSQQLSNFQNAYDGKSLGGDLGADDFSKGWRFGGARGTIQDILEKGAIDQLGLKDFFEELNEKKSTKKKEGIEDLISKGMDMVSLTKNMTPENITSLNNMLANKNFEFTPNNKFASGVVSAFTPLSAKLGMSLLGGEKTVGTITNKETGTSYQVGDRGGLTLNTPDPTVDYGSDAEIKEEEKEVVTKKTPEEVKEETKVEIEKEPRVDPNVKIIMDIYNMTEDEANRFLGNEGVGTGGAGEFEGI